MSKEAIMLHELFTIRVNVLIDKLEKLVVNSMPHKARRF